jgi:cobalt/nickel transport system permease protein
VHVPDGFLDAQTSVATGVLAATAVTVALRKARAELDERTAPLAGLTASFVFAVQMLNFPVGVGTSGHLMGGALAAVLVGPWTAVLCLTMVLLVQGVLFADGGLTALGTNITLIGVVTVAVGWAVTRLALRVLPRRAASVVPAATAGALLSVPVAALVFVGLFEVGGNVDLSLGALTASMVGWHFLIGIGEAVITGLTVSAVVAVRPDLVYAARGLAPALRLRTPQGLVEVAQAGAPVATPRRGMGRLAAAGLATALLLAGVVSFYASANPDGLEFVAGSHGFLDSAKDSAVANSPLADYGVSGIADSRLSGGLAGVIGVVVTVAIALAVFAVLSRRRSHRDDVSAAGTDATAPRAPERV